MVPTIGNFALWLSTFFALLQFVISNKKITPFTFKYNFIAVNGLLISASISFFALMYSYLISDF